MGEEFHAIIKLVSGEEIFALVSVDDSNEDVILILQDPVTLKFLQTPQGGFIKVKPWIELTNENIYLIKLDKIITMTESNDKKLIDIYNNYISDTNFADVFPTDNLIIKPDSKMGYIASVEDARKKLENLFKLNKGSKES